MRGANMKIFGFAVLLEHKYFNFIFQFHISARNLQ